MHVMTAMQLAGQAPEGMQLKNAKLGGVFNMGGAAVANYVSHPGAAEVRLHRRVGKGAKRRAHLLLALDHGGHASLCPSYGSD